MNSRSGAPGGWQWSLVNKHVRTWYELYIWCSPEGWQWSLVNKHELVDHA